ncbi:MAG: Hsp33 family molecular chaperone HslO [Verrucomicrobiales bacterium]|nr:Hsp33 family molecular chaperone HslO [Verrucomicrobiales bacterium]
MENDPANYPVEEAVEVKCYFVRERNALLVRASFTPIYTDYYLHLMEHKIRYEGAQDQMIKDGLTVLALHLASRPWNEAVAWTLSWQDPLQSLFVTGSNRDGTVTGRLFTEDIQERDRDLLFSQISVEGQEGRQSMIELLSNNLFEVGENYYEQSEQRLGRFFCHSEEDFVLITAQPECDDEWLAGLDETAIRELDERETLSLLETRSYRFECGCSQDKIFPILVGMTSDTIDSMFEGQEVIPTSCPRCGAKYAITREALEAFVEENP